MKALSNIDTRQPMHMRAPVPPLPLVSRKLGIFDVAAALQLLLLQYLHSVVAGRGGEKGPMMKAINIGKLGAGGARARLTITPQVGGFFSPDFASRRASGALPLAGNGGVVQ